MMFMHVWITQEPRATLWLLGARVGLAAGCKREFWQGQLATLIQVWLQFHHIQPLAIIGHWAIGWLSVLCSTSPEFDSWSKDICPDHTAEPSGGFTPGNAMKSSVARLVSLNFGLCVCMSSSVHKSSKLLWYFQQGDCLPDRSELLWQCSYQWGRSQYQWGRFQTYLRKNCCFQTFVNAGGTNLLTRAARVGICRYATDLWVPNTLDVLRWQGTEPAAWSELRTVI